jgi:competence protein ComEC
LGGALYILRNFDVRCVIDNGLFPGAPSGLIGAYKKIIREKKIRHIAVTEGETIKGFKDTEIFILNPLAGRPYADENDNSIVMKLVYKNASFLFCGDIKDEAIARLERYGDFLRSDVLKVPHHGGLVADKFSEKKFFEKISPRVSIISTGLKNTPVQRTDAKADVLTRLKSKSYNTSCDGAIFITSDGRSVDVEK